MRHLMTLVWVCTFVSLTIVLYLYAYQKGLS